MATNLDAYVAVLVQYMAANVDEYVDRHMVLAYVVAHLYVDAVCPLLYLGPTVSGL